LLRSFLRKSSLTAALGIIMCSASTAPASAASRKQAAAPTFTAIQFLSGYDNGPGVVVCEPVPSATSSQALAEFGRGCGAWLELSMAGRPEFGRTPPFSELPRAIREMGRPNLAVGAMEATSLSHIVGATDVAIGTIEGDTNRCALTYQIYSADNAQARGAIATASGTETEVVAQLPRIATELARVLDGPLSLKSRPPAIPPQDLTSGEISLIGQLWGIYDPQYVSAGQMTAIGQLAQRSTLGALLYLRFLANTSQTQARLAVDTIYKHGADNLMALAEASALAPVEMKARLAKVKANRAKYPRNYLAALTSTWVARSRHDEAETRKSAEAAVRAAQYDPYSWETLSETISDAAVSYRHGRAIRTLKKPERNHLDSLYRLGVAALQQAVRQDPLNGSAWLHLSIAAAFAADPRLAETAYTNAVRGKVDRYAAYSWALQMFGKHWYDEPARLAEIVHDAKGSTFDNDSETIAMASDLRAAGFSDEANSLLAGAIATTQYTLSANTYDGYAHWRLAAYFRAVGNLGQAITEYHNAESYISNRADLYFTAGLALDAAAKYADAVAEYRKAVRVDPDYAAAHACLGQDLLGLGAMKEAATEIERTVALDPNSSAAHYGRGRLLYARGNPKAGDAEFRKAINLSAGSEQMYYQICWTLDAAGHYKPCIAFGEEALRLHPRAIQIMEQVADAYLNTKQMRPAVKLLEAAIAVNSNDAWAHEKLGEAYVQTGDRGSARNQWQGVLTLGDEAVTKRAQEMLAKYPP